MSNNFTAHIKYERRGDAVVPILMRKEPDHNGRLRTVRITELSFPVTPDAWNTNPKDWCAALDDCFESFYHFNTRARLLVWDIMGLNYKHRKPVLQPANDWPTRAPYLSLDKKAYETHAVDFVAGNDTITNSWVPSLFDDSENAERSD